VDSREDGYERKSVRITVVDFGDVGDVDGRGRRETTVMDVVDGSAMAERKTWPAKNHY
jgi:hypothetical protein